MTWYYGVDGRREGPVEEANLETLELSGAIEWSTPVWRPGMSEWKPFGEMFNRASVRCHECQRNVDQESAVRYRDLFICPRMQNLVLPEGSRGIGQRRNSALRRILDSVFCQAVGWIVLVDR